MPGRTPAPIARKAHLGLLERATATSVGGGALRGWIRGPAVARGGVNDLRHIIPSMGPSLPQGHPSPRILGLDVGSRTIGLAVSDPLGLTAQGLPTIRRKNKRLDFEQLQKVIAEYQVSEIVVGYPLRLSGIEGAQAEKIRQFSNELEKKFSLPVHLWDERLSSAQAHRVLREAGLSIEKRARAIDRMAAVLILASWMEARRAAAPMA
jgi:putative holliday junction resolvase